MIETKVSDDSWRRKSSRYLCDKCGSVIPNSGEHKAVFFGECMPTLVETAKTFSMHRRLDLCKECNKEFLALLSKEKYNRAEEDVLIIIPD